MLLHQQGIERSSDELLVSLLLSCRTSLYILDINPLLDILFTNIFSHSVGCPFTYLIAFFEAHTFLNFDEV